jgi:hypothetical protein
VSFLWFGQIGGLSAVVSLSELEASCLLIAGGTGLFGPRAQTFASLGRLLAQIMHDGTLFVILDDHEWPNLEGKRPLSEAPIDVRDRLRASLEPALARYGAVYRESALVVVS